MYAIAEPVPPRRLPARPFSSGVRVSGAKSSNVGSTVLVAISVTGPAARLTTVKRAMPQAAAHTAATFLSLYIDGLSLRALSCSCSAADRDRRARRWRDGAVTLLGRAGGRWWA